MTKKMLLFILAAFLIAMSGCSEDEKPFGDGLDADWPTTDPDRYHWDGLSNPFSEIWTWHVALPEDNAAIAVTMGVFNPGGDDPDARGGVLYVTSTLLDSPQILLTSVRNFHGSVQIGDVTLGACRGTQNVVRGKIDAGAPISFDFTVDVAKGWENTMGVLTNIPLLPMNWHVNAILAIASGKIVIDGQEYVFENAPALEDHFWGSTYPGSTTRLLAWNFDDPDLAYASFAGQILLGPFNVPNIMIAYQAPDYFYEFRTQDLNNLAGVWLDEDGHYNIDVTKGDVRVHALVLNDDAPPAPDLVFDENGVSLGGSVLQNVVAVIKTYSRAGDGWQLISIETSTLATLAVGVGDPYQQTP